MVRAGVRSGSTVEGCKSCSDGFFYVIRCDTHLV